MNWAGMIIGGIGAAVATFAVVRVSALQSEVESLRTEIDDLHDRQRKMLSDISDLEKVDDEPEIPVVFDEGQAFVKDTDEKVSELTREYSPDDRPREGGSVDIVENWDVVEVFEEDLARTDFQYDADRDVLYKDGRVVDEEYPDILDLMHQNFYLCPDEAGHVSITDQNDPAGRQYTVSVLPETLD